MHGLDCQGRKLSPGRMSPLSDAARLSPATRNRSLMWLSEVIPAHVQRLSYSALTRSSWIVGLRSLVWKSPFFRSIDTILTNDLIGRVAQLEQLDKHRLLIHHCSTRLMELVESRFASEWQHGFLASERCWHWLAIFFDPYRCHTCVQYLTWLT